MSEKSEIKRDGSKATPNSGRGKNYKGDSRLSIFTVDYKESAKSFTLNVSVWGKVALDAWKNQNSTPMLKIILGTNPKTRLCIVEEGVIEDYIRLLEKEELEQQEQQLDADFGGLYRGTMEK